MPSGALLSPPLCESPERGHRGTSGSFGISAPYLAIWCIHFVDFTLEVVSFQRGNPWSPFLALHYTAGGHLSFPPNPELPSWEEEQEKETGWS